MSSLMANNTEVEETGHEVPCGKRRALAVALVGLVVLLVASTGALLLAALLTEPTQRVVSFDAGSSGTRVYVFSVNISGSASSEVIDIDLLEFVKVKPGVSSFADLAARGHQQALVEAVGEYLGPLVDSILANTPPSSTFLCRFEATAGLRENVTPQQATVILEAVATVLDDRLQSSEAAVGIISGQEEGLLEWRAVNYLVGANFDVEHGIVEIGGGSVQFATAVSPAQAQLLYQDDLVFDEVWGGRNYTVFSVSVERMGRNSALQRSRELITDGLDGCLPSGYETIDEGRLLRGTSSAPECRSRASALFQPGVACFNTSEPPQLVHCTWEGVLVPRIPEHLSMFSVDHLAKLLEKVELTSVTVAHLEALASDLCALNYTAYLLRYGKPSDRHLCFGLVYFPLLLRNLGVSEHHEIRATLEHDGAKIGWSWGSGLGSARRRQGTYNAAQQLVGAGGFVALLACLSVLVVASAGGALAVCCKSRESKYTRVS